jgi:hypothetical protein
VVCIQPPTFDIRLAIHIARNDRLASGAKAEGGFMAAARSPARAMRAGRRGHPAERLLVDAVGLVVHPADRADDVVGRLVVLEDPAKLGRVVLPSRLPFWPQRGRSRSWQDRRRAADDCGTLFFTPIRGTRVLPTPAILSRHSSFSEVDGPELAAELLHRLVEVGERHDEGHRSRRRHPRTPRVPARSPARRPWRHGRSRPG